MSTLIAALCMVLGTVLLLLGIMILRIIKNSETTPKPYTIAKSVKDPNIIADNKAAHKAYYNSLLK